MNGLLYVLCLAAGLGLLIYFYIFNFDNMSENQLMDAVLYWYTPLIFGIYGLLATRIKNYIGDAETNVIKHTFSGKDPLLLILAIGLLFFGLLGLLVFLVPLALLDIRKPNFDLKSAVTGAVIWLILLWLFFKLLWPAL